jgi:hypothetical protein
MNNLFNDLFDDIIWLITIAPPDKEIIKHLTTTTLKAIENKVENSSKLQKSIKDEIKLREPKVL